MGRSQQEESGTETNSIFTLSWEDRRDNFVRAQFAQDAWYGREDIEAWLAFQREADKPDLTQWAALVLGAHSGNRRSDWRRKDSWTLRTWNDDWAISGCLERCATPQQHPARLYLSYEGPAIIRLLAALDETQVDLYFGTTAVPVLRLHGGSDVFVLDPPAERRGHGQERPKVEGRRAVAMLSACSSAQLVDVLIAEWHHRRPKWQEARIALCGALYVELITARGLIEADFTTAMACSEDGRRIMNADAVIMVEPRPEGGWRAVEFVQRNCGGGSMFRSAERSASTRMQYPSPVTLADFREAIASEELSSFIEGIWPIFTGQGAIEQTYVILYDARVLLTRACHAPHHLRAPDCGIGVLITDPARDERAPPA
ncbi:MAG: hypothetical protein Q7S96_02070 [bacterium]|nr:hypothetical protein [bacterium]